MKLQINFNELDPAPVNEKDVISEFEWLFDDNECLYGPKRMVVGFIAGYPTLLQFNRTSHIVRVSPCGESYNPDSYLSTIQECLDLLNQDAYEYGNGIVGAVTHDHLSLNYFVSLYHYDREENSNAIIPLTN